MTDRGSRDRRPVAALLIANTISWIGSVLTMIALPWFVLQTTGSASKTGLTGFFVVLPGLIAGVFGGTLVDRFGYRRTSVVADLVSGLGIALIPLLYHTVGLAFWQMLALVFVGSLLEVPGLTARRAMLPELAALGGIRLERVNAAFESINRIALLLGPPLAAVLVALLGSSNVLWLDAASFAVSALVIGMAVPRAVAGTVHVRTGRYRDELVAGLRFLKDDHLLLALALSLAVSNFIGASLFAVILPVYVDVNFGQVTPLGLMASAFGGGSLAGAIAYGAIGHRLPRRAIWLAGFFALPLAYWVLATTPPLPVILAAALATGFIAGPLNPLLVTIRHERIPARLRGRVFATTSAIAGSVQPLGVVLGGVLIEGLGLTPTLLALALAGEMLAVSMLFVPVFAEMNRRAAVGRATEHEAVATVLDPASDAYPHGQPQEWIGR